MVDSLNSLAIQKEQVRGKRMPLKSVMQERKMNAHPEMLGSKKLAEFNSASKGKSLPMKAPKKKTLGERLAR